MKGQTAERNHSKQLHDLLAVLLGTHYIPSTVLGTRYIVENRTHVRLAFEELESGGEKVSI